MTKMELADESTNKTLPTVGDHQSSGRRLAVCTVSTKVSKTTENFLTLCQRLGHNVYVLGRGCEFPHKVFGQPWKWRTKIYLSAIYSLMKREKEPYKPTDLVVCCDSGDLLIVDGPDVLTSKYETLIKASPKSKQLQVIMGAEAICCSGCPDAIPFFNMPHIRAVQKMTMKNGIDVKMNPEIYPNAGFIIGTFQDMLYLMQKNVNSTDDQMGLRRMLLTQPNMFHLDYQSHLVHNFSFRWNTKHDELIGWSRHKKRLQHAVFKSTPSAFHWPGFGKKRYGRRWNVSQQLYNQYLELALESSASSTAERPSKADSKSGTVSYLISDDQASVLITTEPSSWLVFGFVTFMGLLALAAIILVIVTLLFWNKTSKRKQVNGSKPNGTGINGHTTHENKANDIKSNGNKTTVSNNVYKYK